jgi:hypothetical protein
MAQIIQILGSLLILSAYTAAQRGVLSQSSRTYLVLNLVGSVVLTVFAASEHQLGFLLLVSCALSSCENYGTLGYAKNWTYQSCSGVDRSRA